VCCGARGCVQHEGLCPTLWLCPTLCPTSPNGASVSPAGGGTIGQTAASAASRALSSLIPASSSGPSGLAGSSAASGNAFASHAPAVAASGLADSSPAGLRWHATPLVRGLPAAGVVVVGSGSAAAVPPPFP